jgi:hypothetical protein
MNQQPTLYVAILQVRIDLFTFFVAAACVMIVAKTIELKHLALHADHV